MKLRADLRLVFQDDYIEQYQLNSNGDKCLGCVFWATRDEDNSMCERVNKERLTCLHNKIWVIDEQQLNSYKEKP